MLLPKPEAEVQQNVQKAGLQLLAKRFLLGELNKQPAGASKTAVQNPSNFRALHSVDYTDV